MPGPTTPAPGSPYAGITVINVSRGPSGAAASQLLAGFGARVIRVEEPTDVSGTSPSRSVGAGWDPDGDLLTHLVRGSESLVLDLDTDAGRGALARLAAHASVVIEDEPPADGRGVRAALREAREAGATFVHASITPFGLSGPWMNLESSSIVLFAMSGLMNFVGEPDREPVQFPQWLVQTHVGLATFTAIASTIPFDGSAVSSHDLEIAAVEVLANSHPHAVSQTSYTGVVTRRQGSRFIDGYPWTVLKCKDGYIGIIVPQTGWDIFCIWMERPDLITDPRFVDRFARRNHADELDEILVEWASQFTRDELYREGQDRHLPFGAVFTVADGLQSAQLAEREFFDTSADGQTRYAGLPFVLNGVRPRVGAPPALGEHTEALMSEFALLTGEGSAR